MITDEASSEHTNKYFGPLFLGLLMLIAGIFYIVTLGSGHNWGGDFSQYLLQARNIALGRPYDQTGYIYCPYNPTLGPDLYPPGFPLLLSPIYRIFGLSFVTFKLEIIIFLILSLPVLWFLFQDYLSKGYRAVLLGLFIFSPWLVSFKENILSDIPFFFWLYLSFMCISLIYKRDYFTFGFGVLLTVLFVFSSLVRTPGLLLIPALLVYDILHNKRPSRFSMLVALFSVTLILASRFLFSGEITYLDQMYGWNPRIVTINFVDYVKELALFWPQTIYLPHFNVFIFLLASLLAVGGFITRHRRLSIVEFFLIPYAILVLIWPARQGLRFLLPFIPIYLMYLLVGVDNLSRLFRSGLTRITYFSTLGIFALIAYGLGLQMVIQELNSLPDGPFSEQATQLFAYVEKQTGPNDVFVFRRPRVLSLFTNRSATTYPYENELVTLSYFTEVGVTQVIVDFENDEDQTWLVPLLTQNPSTFHKMFENTRFAVFFFDNNDLTRRDLSSSEPVRDRRSTVTDPLQASNLDLPSMSNLLSDKSFFPLGFMGIADETQFPQIAAFGFNVVYEFRSIQEIDEAEDYLRQAEATGLKVIQNMPACRVYETKEPICDEFKAYVWSEAEWGQFISTLATHDNLVAWFLPDEITDYSAAANLYKWIHTYDPLDRPVFANPGSWDQSIIGLFPAFSEFIWTAAYPEYGGDPRAIVTYAMRQDAQVCLGTDTRWGAILQFFDSVEFGGSGGHPTARELRADSYQAIIGGASGLWYFNYEMGKELDDLLPTLEKIADEIIGTGGLDEVLLSPAAPQTIVKTIISGPTQSPPVQGESYDAIQMLQKVHHHPYLFAVNIAADDIIVEFSNLPNGTAKIEILFEDRTIPISSEAFQDNFARDEVHIYRLITAK